MTDQSPSAAVLNSPSSREQDEATLRIVLADDHAVVRAGIRMLLESQPGWEVVAESPDADSAARQVRGHKPDVLILDLAMPGRSSLDVVPQIRRDTPRTCIVILTMEADAAFARKALGAGASGYVLKEAADSELVDAIRRAAAGGSYLDPMLGAELAAMPPERNGVHDQLTDRELDVLRLIALGNTNTEIAAALCLSVRTVESHRGHIQAKTGRSTRAELVSYALEAGLLDEYLHRPAERTGG
jgi:two-component system response regulator NreC